MENTKKADNRIIEKIKTNRVVGIDIRKINDFGIGSYIRHLLFGLAETTNLPNTVFRLYLENRSSLNTKKLSPDRFPIVSIPIGRRKPAQGILPGSVNLDAYHAPHYLTPDPGTAPLILTVHDCIHLSPPPFPTEFKRLGNLTDQLFDGAKRFYHRSQGLLKFSRLVKKATAIITVSDATSRQLVELTGVDASKISRIYNCVDRPFYNFHSETEAEKQTALFCEKYNLPVNNYFLYCGNDLYHKNLAGLLTAWKKLSEDIEPPTLVIAGPPRHIMIREYAESLGIMDKIILLSRLQSSNLPYLYNGAQALITPTLAEGFGLPVAEAMVMEVPVICSDIPVLKEITGGHAIFFNPYLPASIVEAIKLHLNKPDVSKKNTVYARDYASTYSIETFISSHRDVYNRVLEVAE